VQPWIVDGEALGRSCREQSIVSRDKARCGEAMLLQDVSGAGLRDLRHFDTRQNQKAKLILDG
jgi:hypothetical protein